MRIYETVKRLAEPEPRFSHNRATAVRLLWCVWILALVDLDEGRLAQPYRGEVNSQRNAPTPLDGHCDLLSPTSMAP